MGSLAEILLNSLISGDASGVLSSWVSTLRGRNLRTIFAEVTDGPHPLSAGSGTASSSSSQRTMRYRRPPKRRNLHGREVVSTFFRQHDGQEWQCPAVYDDQSLGWRGHYSGTSEALAHRTTCARHQKCGLEDFLEVPSPDHVPRLERHVVQRSTSFADQVVNLGRNKGRNAISPGSNSLRRRATSFRGRGGSRGSRGRKSSGKRGRNDGKDPSQLSGNNDYIIDLVKYMTEERNKSTWSPAKLSQQMWTALAMGPHLGKPFIHLQYQSTDIYSTNIAAKSLPGLNYKETSSGESGRFVCSDQAASDYQTAMGFVGGNYKPGGFLLPTVNFRDKKNAWSRIHVQLKEFGMDGKPDRILWDAIYDPRLGLKLPEPGYWDFSFLYPVGGAKKTMTLPCVPKYDPRPHWFDLKLTNVAKFKPKEISHWQEGWETLGGKAAHIGFTVQRHPIMENPMMPMFGGLYHSNPLGPLMGPEYLKGTPKRDYAQNPDDDCDDLDKARLDKCRNWGAGNKRKFSEQSTRSMHVRWPTEFERRLHKDSDPLFYYSDPQAQLGGGSSSSSSSSSKSSKSGKSSKSSGSSKKKSSHPIWMVHPTVNDSHGYYWWTKATIGPLPMDQIDDGRPPIVPGEGAWAGLSGIHPSHKQGTEMRFLTNSPGLLAQWDTPDVMGDFLPPGKGGGKGRR
ncbi:unnamed protein product [Amoebophrya sp. A25]|nr:unnamed protein product [Amoebophrya sp. A25]|eukprot:GSA25T00000370001.1